MKRITKTEVSLFLSAGLQVLLVAVNTYQLAHKKWVGCVIVGFLISFIWTFNVKKISIGSLRDRIFYAAGAATGTLAGLLLSIYVYEILKL
jgi:hypothetical protein